MTTRNNYNHNKNGKSIEFTVFYDGLQAGETFKENFDIIQSGRRSSTVLYYTAGGEVDSFDKVEFTVKGTNAAKIAALTDWHETADLETWPEEDLNAEILARYEVNLTDYALDRLENIKDLEFLPTKDLIVTSSTGHCQGDYSKIIYCPADLEKARGVAPDQNALQKNFDDYLWNQPVYARAEVDGEEYYYFEMDDYNEYDFDRAAFLAYVAKESGATIEELDSVCPKEPSYD